MKDISGFSALQRLHADITKGHPVILIVPGENSYHPEKPKTLPFDREAELHHWLLAALTHGFIAVKVSDELITRLRDVALVVGIKVYTLTGVPEQNVSVTASALLSDVFSITLLELEGLNFDREHGTMGHKGDDEDDLDSRIASAHSSFQHNGGPEDETP